MINVLKIFYNDSEYDFNLNFDLDIKNDINDDYEEFEI